MSSSHVLLETVDTMLVLQMFERLGKIAINMMLAVFLYFINHTLFNSIIANVICIFVHCVIHLNAYSL